MLQVQDLAGSKVVVCCGLGNPAHLLQQVEAAGMDVTAHLSYPDHVHYGGRELASIRAAARGADGIITSAKDWVKLDRCPEIAAIDEPFLVPRLRIVFDRGAEAFTRALKQASGRDPVL